MPVISIATAATCVNLCIGLNALANATGWGLEEVKRALGCLQDASTLKKTVSALGLEGTAKTLAKEACARANALLASPEFAAHARDRAAHFDQVLDLCSFDPELFVSARIGSGVTDLWLNHIVAAAPRHLASYYRDDHAPDRAFFTAIVTPVLTDLLRDPAFQPVLEFYRWTDAFAQLDRIEAQIARLTAELADMKAAAEARSAGVSEKALFRLVRPIAEHIDDVGEALLALKEAVDIAKRVQEEGRHGSNLGDFVDEVLRRTSALSADGQHETAISELEDALAREEAESKARTDRLLKAAIDQHLLAFDATGAADKIARRVALDTPDPAARFKALRMEFIAWYKRGHDKGLRLDLEIAIAVARIAHANATTADDRGKALNDRGTALQTLGEREQGTERLEEAIACYRDALTERTRDRVPLQWAMTQMNLGTALATLGEREQGTERLVEAIACYRDALTERTRDRVPLQWARTQMNLGTALATLTEREEGTERLEEAIACYRDALTEWTRDRVPMDWAMTQMNLGAALQTLGQREEGTERLEEAIACYRDALTEWTRDRVPLDWAMTQMNLGNALRTLGEREEGTKRLEEAIACYRDALTEYTRDRVPIQWAGTRGNEAVALYLLAERQADADLAGQALTQLTEAARVLRAGGHIPWADECERQIPDAQALLDRLSAS